FQTVLLAGYLCAHAIATLLRPRVQAIVYSILLAASLAQVASNLKPELRASTVHPVYSVLWLLTVLIGLPFLVLSATSPLLQAWYARGPARSGTAAPLVPPYRLFALSNLGSLLALIAYPALVEPYFSLHAQTGVWSAGFLVFVLVCGAISLGARNTVARGPQVVDLEPAPAGKVETPPAPSERTMWLLMAACGALLLSAVTSHLSQNIAAIPLLWIVPLTIYLLTFVIAFNGKLYFRGLMVRLLAVVLGSVAYLIVDIDKQVPIKISVPLLCVALFICCLFCHGELYRRRPSPRYTTQYYLLIAAGGALGSMFVGVVAPFIFLGSYELAWALVYTAALATAVMWKEHWAWRLFWPAITATLLVAVGYQVHRYGEDTIVQVRRSYGIMRVKQETTQEGELYRTLVHGTIQHGTQYYGSDEDRTSPTTYYTHNSGVGLAIDNCCKGRPRRIAVIGLGAGT